MNFRLGLFDSGVGGLTVLKRIVERHGDLPCVYLGDIARVPYGNKNSSQINGIAFEVVQWLKKQDVSAVVIACNTTNSLAMNVVKRYAEVPVFSLIQSIENISFGKKIGVLATPATIKSNAYKNHILSLNPSTFVIEQSCPELVSIIESHGLNSLRLRALVQRYLKPLLEANVDTVILGCTHYPLLEPLIREELPQNVRLVDPAVYLARQLDSFLSISNEIYKNDYQFSNTRFCITEKSTLFPMIARDFLNIYPNLEIVSLLSKACVS